MSKLDPHVLKTYVSAAGGQNWYTASPDGLPMLLGRPTVEPVIVGLEQLRELTGADGGEGGGGAGEGELIVPSVQIVFN